MENPIEVSALPAVSAPGIYALSEDAYHADPCPAPAFSSSIAKILLDSTPLHAWTAHPKLNPNWESKAEAKFDQGSACHALLLEGINKIKIIEAENWRTKAAQTARDEARRGGLIPMLEHESKEVIAMCSAKKSAIDDNKDLIGVGFPGGGLAEHSIIWNDEEFGLWCKGKPDWLSNQHDLMLDLKTTGKSANPIAWAKAMLAIGADIQAALYIRGLKAVDPSANPKFVFMVQESDPPYASSFIGMNPAFVSLGMDKVEIAMRIWAECLRKNEWPAYANRIYYPDPPAWALDQWNNDLERLTA